MEHCPLHCLQLVPLPLIYPFFLKPSSPPAIPLTLQFCHYSHSILTAHSLFSSFWPHTHRTHNVVRSVLRVQCYYYTIIMIDMRCDFKSLIYVPEKYAHIIHDYRDKSKDVFSVPYVHLPHCQLFPQHNLCFEVCHGEHSFCV